jgi:purine-nucleoside phosphorylase
MGDISKAVFEREYLPKTVIIRAGGYYERRSQLLLSQFDDVEEKRLEWCPFTYAKSNGMEYLVIFNVYGASVTLEVLKILKEGSVENVLFIGSMFSKNCDIGQYLLIREVIDRTGLVSLASGSSDAVQVNPKFRQRLETYFQENNIRYETAKIMSVPCVLHGIEHIQLELKEDDTIEGVEMELSTFYHFGQQMGLNLYSFLYVSDNPTHHMMTTNIPVRELRKERMELLGRLMLEFGNRINSRR